MSFCRNSRYAFRTTSVILDLYFCVLTKMLFGSIYDVRINVSELSAFLQFGIFLRKVKKMANYFMVAVTGITSLKEGITKC